MKTKIILLSFFLAGALSLVAQNKVLDFDAGTNSVIVDNPIVDDTDFTAELWFKGNNGANPRASLFSWGPVSGGGLDRFIVLTNNNKLSLIDDNFNSGTAYIRPFLFDVDDDGEWHHLAVVKDGNQITIYLDNATPYVYTTGVANSFNLLDDLRMGRPAATSWQAWRGQMDEFRVWEQARTEAEILETRNCKLDGNEPGLLIYYDAEFPYGGLDGNDYIPDLSTPNNDGLLFDFTRPILTADIGVNTVCGQVCSTSFSTERETCSSTFDFLAAPGAESYLWEVTRSNPVVNDVFTTRFLSYDFDFRQLIGQSTNYSVCLTVTYSDGCEAENCETIVEPIEDQNYYEITNSVSDVNLTANSETCNASSNAQFLRLLTCPGTLVSQVHSRSDGRGMNEPYEIGSTTVTVSVGYDIGLEITGFIPLETFTYQVTVDPTEGCCDLITSINLGTGLDENGNRIPPDFGLVDQKWRLLNNPPYENGCTSTLQSAINGSAYLMNFVSSPTGWANQSDVTTLAPIDLGADGLRFECNNFVNSIGQRVPFVFERAFCVASPDSININFTTRGDDRVFYELWDIDNNMLIATSPTYNYPNATLEWDYNITLTVGTYAVRAKLANIGSTTLGFSVKGGITSYSTGQSFVDKGACCVSNSINVLNTLDLDCSGSVSAGDLSGSEWTYELYDANNNLVQSATTDVNGELFFSGLDEGSYTIIQNTESGYSPNLPSTGSLQLEITDDSFNTVSFFNCPSSCFTVSNTEITCLDYRTYEVSLNIINNNDQIFDRILTFSQNNQTAVNPTISIDFGDGQPMLLPGMESGDITFQVRRQGLVAEEIDVCFDVIPQNPAGGDCCKDDFCITLPVCCDPEDSKDNIITLSDNEQDCCYDISIRNSCAEDYFTAVELNTTDEAISLSSSQGFGGWNIFNHNDGTVAFFYQNGVAGDDQDYVPVYDEETTIGTICVDGVTSANEMNQGITLGWITTGDEDSELTVCTDTLATECPVDPCNLIFNPVVSCDELGNYHLDFSMQISGEEPQDTRLVVISGLNGTTVDQYSPQTFEELSLAPGSISNYSLDLFNVQPGGQFSFTVTLHDFDNPMEDGSFYCCYTGEEVTVNIPPCIMGEPGIQLDPAELDTDKPISYVIYPNPVHDDFTIAFEQKTAESLGLELINMQGELITTKIIEEGTDRYSLSMRETLPAIYFIRLKNDNGSLGYRKILKL